MNTPNEGLHASRQAIDMIKDFEIRAKLGRVSLEAFDDDGSHTWTIGWGRVNHPGRGKVQPGEKIDLETAERYFQEDLGIAERHIKTMVKVPLTQGQFDALSVITCNFGGGNLQRSSILKLINAGKMADVPAAWMRYVYATDQKTKQKYRLTGLERRRRAELGLWRDLSQPDREEAVVIVPGSITDKKPGAVTDTVRKSWTIFGALTSAFGMVVQYFDQAISFGLEAVAEVSRLEPMKHAAMSVGGNLRSIGFAIAAAGVVTVIGRRIDAARNGRPG